MQHTSIEVSAFVMLLHSYIQVLYINRINSLDILSTVQPATLFHQLIQYQHKDMNWKKHIM